MTRRISWFIGASALLLPLGAMAQPAPRSQLSSDLIVSDLSLDAVYLLRDLNGDGNADGPGEATPFVDGSEQSGFGLVSGSVFSMLVLQDGTVLIGEGDTDAMYALRDLNGDGDANDPGEVTIFFSSAFSAVPYQTPQGLGADDNGYIYAATAGAGSTAAADYVYRIKDLNGNGTADDPGESTLFFNAGAVVPNSNPFALTMVGDVLYFIDFRGSASDVIFRAHDDNANGMIDANEYSIYLDSSVGINLGYGLVSDGTDLYVVDGLASNTQRMFRLHDDNHNNFIDFPGEATEVWNETMIPPGVPVLGTAFDLALGPDGMAAVISSGADAADDVFLLTDLNHDGDWLDAGETTVFRSGNGSGVFPETVRAVRFLAKPQGCAVTCDYNQDGAGDTSDVLDLANDIAAGTSTFPASCKDYNQDGSEDTSDVIDLAGAIASGTCP